MAADYYSNPKDENARSRKSSVFASICLLISSLAVVILVTLLGTIFFSGQKALFVEKDEEGTVVSKFVEPEEGETDEEEPIVPKGEVSNGFNWGFLTKGHAEDKPEQSGIGIAIIGSTILCVLCALVAIPIGIGTAIFLEEFQPRNKYLRWLHGLVQLNISNLAGVPSIVYGILGVTAFVYMFSLLPRIQVNEQPSWESGLEYYYQAKSADGTFFKFPAGDGSQIALNNDSLLDDEGKLKATIKLTDGDTFVDENGKSFTIALVDRRAKPPENPDPNTQYVQSRRGRAKASKFPVRSWWYFRLPFGNSLLAAALTLALVVLPIVIISSQEAIRAVPRSIREAGFGMGATRWQVVRKTVLPAATPGIMTGAILSMSRAIGEAAPVLAVMGSLLTKTRIESLMDQAPVLPVTIYSWAGDENPGFENASSAAIIVLLVILLVMNSIAIFIRNRYEKKLS